MEAFCCSNDKREDTIDNENLHGNNISSSSYTKLKQNINNSKLPSNGITLNNINEVLQLKTHEEKRNNPFKDYILIEKIAEKDISEVFMIKNTKNNDIFALKRIKKNKNDINITDEKIKNIIEKFKQLNHAYLNKIYEYFITNDYIFLLEEFCSEGNLEDKIKKTKIFPEFIVKIIMFEIFKALIYLNKKNLYHGNLKLQNILIEKNDIKSDKKTNKKNIELDEDKFIKAIDKDIILVFKNLKNQGSNYNFDIKNENSTKIINKKINESQIRSESSKMSTGLRFGIQLSDYNKEVLYKNEAPSLDNIIYLSPETLSENKSTNSDIWSCGIIMFYLLSSYFPFSGESIEEIKNKILLGKFIFDYDKFIGISEDAKDLIKKCLKVDKDLRINLSDTVKHPFFDDLKDSNVYLIDEKKILENLKNQKERPIFYQMVLTFISYNFKDTELLMELSRIFYKIDRNSDGKITKEDLTKAYEEAGDKIKKGELDEIIKMIDFDRNGLIEYDEFIRVCIPEDRLFTEDNLKDAFDLFDKEKKNEITYLNVVEALEREDRINGKMIELLKAEVGKMGNEKLNFEKFKKIMEELSMQ